MIDTSDTDAEGNPIGQDAANDASSQPMPTAGNDLFAAPANVSGTFASVAQTGQGGAPVLKAGGNITVSATNDFAVSATAGSGSGGLVSIGISVALMSVTDTTQATVGSGTVLSAGGNIDIGATDLTYQQGNVNATTGQVGFAAVGGAVAHTTLDLDVSATLAPDVTILRGAKVIVGASQSASLLTSGFDASGGGIAIGIVDAETTIDGSVVASVGQGDHIGTAGPVGSLSITSVGIDDGATSAFAGSGGIVAGDGSLSKAMVSPQLTASLGDDTDIQVAGNVYVGAETTGTVNAQAEGVDVGGIAIGVSEADATLATKTTASIGQNALVVAGGDVTVSADHETADGVIATASSSGGGALSGNGATGTALDSGSASAVVGDGTTVDAGGIVDIFSTTSNNAQGNANTLSIGFAAIGAQIATANTAGVSSALLGNGTTVHAEELQVEAAGSDVSTTSSVAAAGGVFGTSVGAEADSNSSPNVTAVIGENATVVVLATVDVLAVADPSASSTVDGTSVSGFYAGGSSNANATGTPVVNAEIEQNSQIRAGGGVQVVAQTPTTGSYSNGSFDAGNATIVDLAKNEFILTAPTLLQTGDQVVYETNGGTPIGGLTSGRTYSVINDGNGLSLGQTFSGANVNTAQGTIQFASPDGFVTGDKIVYSSNGGTPIGGLVNGATYYVRVINPTTIKLATSEGEAIQSGEAFNPALITATGLITIAANGFTNGEAVTYRSTGTSINGLVNGDTYFVQRVNANQFRLSAIPNGPALSLGGGSATGLQTIGSEGVAIDGAGITEQQSLIFKLTSKGSGIQQLVGAGGAAAALPLNPSDAYNATANASGGAIAGNIGSQSNVTVTGQTTASIDSNATVQSGGDIAINVSAQRPSEDDAQGSGSGFVGLGSGTAVTTDIEITNAQVGAGATLVSGQDVLITVDDGIEASGIVQSNGGGAVKSSDANMTVDAVPDTGITVGQNANISAPGNVTLGVQQELGGNAQSSAGGFGFFGSGSNANSYFLVGAPGNPATLSIQVGDGASLTGSNILLNSSFDGLQPQANSYAYPRAPSCCRVPTPTSSCTRTRWSTSAPAPHLRQRTRWICWRATAPADCSSPKR